MKQLVDEIITCGLEEIKNLNFPRDKQFGLIVNINNIKFEFLLNIKSNTNKLLVFAPGARDPSSTIEDRNRPIFHRWSWEFEESTIHFNDPTTYLSHGLLGGWGIGTMSDWYLIHIANIITEIINNISISRNNVIFYGSSLGGFISIMLSILIKNTKSIAEIPQFDVSLWHFTWPHLKRFCFNNLDETTILEKYGYRLDIIRMMEKEDYIPNSYIIVDCSHEYDFKNINMPFFKRLDELPYGNEKFNLKFRFDGKNQGHAPLSYEKSFGLIKNVQSINNEYHNNNSFTLENNETSNLSYFKNNNIINKVIKLNFSEIENYIFPLNEPFGLEINYKNIIFCFIIKFSSNNKNLICFGSGEHERNKKNLKGEIINPPFFDISSWYLAYSDPMFFDDDEISLGWFVGTKDYWYLEILSKIIKKIAFNQKIFTNNILFYGSQGGGFSSVCLGTLIPNSKVLINNSQLSILNYNEPYVNNLFRILEDYFPNFSREEIINVLDYRLDVINLFKKENYVPEILYYLNIKSYEYLYGQCLSFIKEISNLDFFDKIDLKLYNGSENSSNEPLNTKLTVDIIKYFAKKNLYNEYIFEDKGLSSDYNDHWLLMDSNMERTSNGTLLSVDESSKTGWGHFCINSSTSIRYFLDSHFIVEFDILPSSNNNYARFQLYDTKQNIFFDFKGLYSVTDRLTHFKIMYDNSSIFFFKDDVLINTISNVNSDYNWRVSFQLMNKNATLLYKNLKIRQNIN